MENKNGEKIYDRILFGIIQNDEDNQSISMITFETGEPSFLFSEIIQILKELKPEKTRELRINRFNTEGKFWRIDWLNSLTNLQKTKQS